MDANWHIRLFGGLHVLGPDTNINRFPTKRSALLLARLALSRTGSVSRDDLAEALWPDDFLDSTRVRLRQELNRLRETLGNAADILEADRSWVRLDFEKVSVDAREFERILKEKSANPEAVGQALELYVGQLLPEQTEEWVQAHRQELHTSYLTALVEHADQLLTLDRKNEAVTYAMRAVRSDPLNERARMAAMRALQLAGDATGAMRLYSDFEKAIFKEYGTKPSEQLHSVFASLKTTPQPIKEVVATQSETEGPSAPLPAYLDSIVGRADELKMIEGWLVADRPVRLITLTGPGGVGKTRLAITAAAATKARFQDNVFFIGLADIEPGHSVTAKIQKAFNPSAPSFSDDPLSEWGDRTCLLVLDNAEHVLDDARTSVQRILTSHPNVSLIITSRQRLGLGGEQEFPLSPLVGVKSAGDKRELDESPAAQLFLQRARAIKPGYVLSEDQIESLGLLIDRLDGLPLSIELAAARIGALNPSQMLDQIDDRFTFLVSRRGDVAPRQRSLRATIEWSFQDLSTDLRETMECFATFRSGWTLDLAKAATERTDVDIVIQDLMDRSLIYVDDFDTGHRFGMLEAIRDFVLAQMDETSLSRWRDRHCQVIADFVQTSAANLTGAEQDKFFRLIQAEMDNAVTALEWATSRRLYSGGKIAASMWRVWCARGKPMDGAELLDALLAKLPDEPDFDWGVACGGRGIIGYLLCDDNACDRWFAESARIFDSLNRPNSVSWARYNLVRSLQRRGRIRDADGHIEFALTNALERNRPSFRFVRAGVWVRMGKFDEAMALAEEAFAGYLSHSDIAGKALAYSQLADIYFDCGRYDAVRGLHQEALEQLRFAPVQDYEMYALLGLANEELRQQNLAGLDDVLQRAHRIAGDLRDHISLITTENLGGQAAELRGDKAAALKHFETALNLALPNGGGIATLQTVRLVADTLVRLDNPEGAKKLLGMEAALRDSLGCGLTLHERSKRALTIDRLGADPEPISVDSSQQLAAKSLAILKSTPVVATV